MNPLAELGAYLSAGEAEGIAVLLDVGEHRSQAVHAVSTSRRQRAAELLTTAGLGHADRERSVSVLQAIAGAKSVHRQLIPVWTMPGNEAKIGHLTGEFHRLVEGARVSVTCASYNFTNTSNMWAVLKDASDRAGVTVCVYVDADKGEPSAIKVQLPQATVYKSARLADGHQIVSHTKFIVIDHEIVLLTSANFSWSAENRNIEFGLLVQDGGLAASIEATMASKHGTLYELA
jgi:phosphatidylserine/phosphatidylglycerophosphate/cardiolipin synthase-like enzyme